MVTALGRLVACESPSAEPAACRRAAETLAEVGTDLLGEPAILSHGGRSQVLWQFGDSIDVLVIGHIDTVFPLGTIDQRPFEVRDGIATGPGVYDMKAGLVQALHAIGALDDRSGVALLVTDDEEIGSAASRTTIESLAASAHGALVLEGASGGLDGLVKTGRRGYSGYEIEVSGRSAHAGMNPEDGVNAAVEAAHVVLAVAGLADPLAGSHVAPTVVHVGTAVNVIPDRATILVDVRMTDPGEQDRIDRKVRALAPTLQGATLAVGGGPNRPPMPESATRSVFEMAREVAAELGLPPLGGTAVGGGSDASFIAPLGIPVLDGLGAVGGGGHQPDEWASVAHMPERAALLTALIDRILTRPP